MVGVPGRSKGCHTCRRRHVKCDERKPTCFRCERAGYVCQGYKKTIRFMMHNPGGTQSSSSSRSSESPPGLTIIPAGTFKPKQNSNQRKTVEKKNSLIKKPPTQTTRLPSSVPQELHLTAFQDDMAFSFTFSNLVYSSFGRPWLQMAAQGRVDEVSEAACKALALGFYGNTQRQTGLQDRSFKAYGRSLQILIRDLANLDLEKARRCIIPVMIILMYTFSVNKSSDFGHHEGLKKLVIMCGPEQFKEQPYLAAFEAARDILISKALMERKRSFLEQEQWKTVPWERDPQKRSPSCRLLDILSVVPGLLEDEDSLDNHPDPQPLRAALLAQTQDLLQELFKWRWEWEARNPDAAHAVEAANGADGLAAIPEGLETVLRYKKFVQANEICLYNAVLLWLLRFLGDLCPIEPIPGPDSPESDSTYCSTSEEYAELAQKILYDTAPTPLLLPGQARTLKQPALEICRSFEYLLENFAQTEDTALAWLMPLSLAYYVLKDDKAYVQWIKVKLDAFQDFWVVVRNSPCGTGPAPKPKNETSASGTVHPRHQHTTMPRIELSELVRYNPGLWSCPPEGDQLPPDVEDPGPWSHPLAGYQLPPKLSDSPVSPAPNSLVFLQPNVCPYTMMAALVRGRANMSPIELTEIVKSTPELSYDPLVDMVPRGGRGDPWSHFQAKNGWNEKFIEEVAVSSRPSGESSRVVDDSSYSMLHSREGPKYGMPFGWFYGGRVKMFGSL